MIAQDTDDILDIEDDSLFDDVTSLLAQDALNVQEILDTVSQYSTDKFPSATSGCYQIIGQHSNDRFALYIGITKHRENPHSLLFVLIFVLHNLFFFCDLYCTPFTPSSAVPLLHYLGFYTLTRTHHIFLFDARSHLYHQSRSWLSLSCPRRRRPMVRSPLEDPWKPLKTLPSAVPRYSGLGGLATDKNCPSLRTVKDALSRVSFTFGLQLEQSSDLGTEWHRCREMVWRPNFRKPTARASLEITA